MYHIKDAIYDIMSVYPYYNKEMLKDSLEFIIRSKIIPNVFLNLKLPKTHSRAELKMLEFRQKRSGLRNIDKYLNKLKGNDLLSNKFEYVKYQFLSKTHKNETFSYNNLYFDKNNVFENYLLTDTDYDYNLLETKEEDLKKMRNDDPYIPIIKVKESYLDIKFNYIANKKIIDDNYYMIFFEMIEKYIRRSNYSNEIQEICIEDKIDIIMQDWNKIVINIIPKENNFDDNIILWDNLQNDVRMSLLKDIQKLDSDNKKELNYYFDNIFFHMNFMEDLDE